MVIPLLILFAIALVITIAGLLLTTRSSTSDSEQREISYPQRQHRTSTHASAYLDNYESNVANTRRHVSQPTRRSTQTRTRYSYNTGTPLNTFNRTTNYEKIRKPLLSLPDLSGQYTPWLGILLILLALSIFSLYTIHNMLSANELIMSNQWPDVAVASGPPAASQTDLQLTQLFPGTISASQNLQRISQLDPSQYDSTAQYNTWAYSTCSTTAMTEIMNAYGRHYRIADVLAVEVAVHGITPQLGLLDSNGVNDTVAHFGFKTYWPAKPTLDEIIQIANSGRPVMVGFPPSRWQGGHLLVVRGGNNQYVFLADSSSYDLTSLTRQQFMKYWAGYAVVITPIQQTTALAAPPTGQSAPTAKPAAFNASQHVVRIAQNNPKQYSSTAQLNDWSTVDSSAAVMTEVINAYGHNYRIADILQEEIAVRGIDPSLGLLSAYGITKTVAHFGFTATILPLTSPTSIVQLANRGEPVIISFPPSRWPGGHLLVVTGGNSSIITLVDSSQQNIKSISYQNFARYWGGFAVVIKPK